MIKKALLLFSMCLTFSACCQFAAVDTAGEFRGPGVDLNNTNTCFCRFTPDMTWYSCKCDTNDVRVIRTERGRGIILEVIEND